MTSSKKRSKIAQDDDKRSPIPSDKALEVATERWGLSGIEMGTLRKAFIHTSAVPAKSHDSNERLEFLGDSIVNASIADYLFRAYPERSEGELAKGRALVVCKVSLYEAGVRLGLPELIHVGANVEGALARGRRSIVADAFEALVAVIYTQLGWEQAKDFVLKSLRLELGKVAERHDLRDPKTILQELSQSQHQAPPQYKIVAEHGDAHLKTFTAEVTTHEGMTATGTGRSKKDAEQAAAGAILEHFSVSSPASG